MIRVTLATGVELDVVDQGPREAPALVFLHGFPESHRTWRHQLARFADEYRCIAPDQRGYHGSSRPMDVAAYAPAKLVADVFALADALAIDRFTVIGHDWGGAIAWGVALEGQAGAPDPQRAGRVTRAVIANAPHPFLFQRLLIEHPAQRAASQYMRTFRDPASDAVVRDRGLAALLRQALGWQRPAALEPSEAEALLAGWQDPESAIAMLNWYRASPIVVPAMDETPPRPAILDRPFPVLRSPTLVIWALEDRALLPANLDGLVEHVPAVRIVEVAGSGHFVPWEAPGAVNRALADFLVRTGSPGARN
jgi:pimeloyl-ACP methyl ester carboxylesterase